MLLVVFCVQTGADGEEEAPAVGTEKKKKKAKTPSSAAKVASAAWVCCWKGLVQADCW